MNKSIRTVVLIIPSPFCSSLSLSPALYLLTCFPFSETPSWRALWWQMLQWLVNESSMIWQRCRDDLRTISCINKIKILTTQKLRVIFYLRGIFRISSPGSSISSNPGRTALRRWWGEIGYLEVLQQRADGQRIIINSKKNRYLNLRTLVLCFAWEDTRIWAH